MLTTIMYGKLASIVLPAVLLLASLGPGRAGAAPSAGLRADFQSAAREFHVPQPVLLAVAYTVSRWEAHPGTPSATGGYGVMQLTHADQLLLPDWRGDYQTRRGYSTQGNAGLHTMDAAAKLLGVDWRTLAASSKQNIRGGAALLARYARDTLHRQPRTLGDWYGAEAKYSGSSRADIALGFADAVTATIRHGVARRISSGELIRLAPHHLTPNRQSVAWVRRVAGSRISPECPKGLKCRFIPAAYRRNSPTDPTDWGNYSVANRPRNGMKVQYIVIHDTETSYAQTIQIFQDSKKYASANYVLRSSDGLVTQMVQNKNVSWHAGDWYVNMHSVGIEHEGVAIDGAAWYTERMYRASAKLVRYLARKYGVPLDRLHILGHDNVPGSTPQIQSIQHWDPGPFWNWAHYMALLGAPIKPARSPGTTNIITIDPNFATNEPPLTYCYTPSDCRAVPPQPANFVYLHTLPSEGAPLLGDPALHPGGGPGTLLADDWGDKAVTGQQFVQVGRQGDWTAIDYAGRGGWFFDPPSQRTSIPGRGKVVTPRGNFASIPVYGTAYPEATAYHKPVPPQPIVPLQYRIPNGQRYVLAGSVTSNYFWSNTQTQSAYVQGTTRYYAISFNHRLAYVRADDVNVLGP